MFWLEASSRVTVGKIDEGDFAYGKRKPPPGEASTYQPIDFQLLARSFLNMQSTGLQPEFFSFFYPGTAYPVTHKYRPTA